MRVSLNWLCELVPGLPRSSSVIADALTSVGLEVEGVSEFGAGLEPLLFGVVLAIEPHPNREKLQLVKVSLGSNREQTVVCGASNVPAPGGMVVLAPLGTHLPAVSMTLEPRAIGGITSEGMLCSETELGLAADADGILTFEPGRFAAGSRFLDAFPDAPDTIFELSITPNRPDALGHIGVARDLAARLDLELKLPHVEVSSNNAGVAEWVSVENRAPDACPRYGAAVVKGVKLGPSPEWLRWRLYALGVRPISNVVDVTNLLLLESGNPMHAFDLERVAGSKIIIRRAAKGERMTTLDGSSHELDESDLVIADERAPSALAGIMGGADSEIRAETRDVLLECAYFEPAQIRRTSRRLGLSTDSSYRFERGVNWAGLEQVLGRASQWLVELAHGNAIPGQLFADGARPELAVVRLRRSRLNALLGTEIDFVRALNKLERLGFEIVSRNAEAAEVRAAAFRPDISLEADLIEEIARLIGLDAIPTELPPIVPSAPSRASVLERRCRHTAVELGLNEAVCYSFVSSKTLERLRCPPPVVRLQNPLTEERDVMTTSLLPGLLDAVRNAHRHGENNLTLFSVSAVFLPPPASLPAEAVQAARPRAVEDLGQLPEERLGFAAVLSGQRVAYLEKAAPLDVYDAKGVAVELVERLVRRPVEVTFTREQPHLHPRAAAFLSVAGTRVGHFGQLHPDIADELELPQGVSVVELDLYAIEQLGKATPRYTAVPRLPAIIRDVALDVPDQVQVGPLLEALRKGAGELCESIELFDVFRPSGDDVERRSLAFRLVYRDPKAATDPEHARTLTDKQVDARQREVLAAAASLGAVQRA